MTAIEFQNFADQGNFSSKAAWLFRAIAQRFAALAARLAIVREVKAAHGSSSYRDPRDKAIRAIVRLDPIGLTML